MPQSPINPQITREICIALSASVIKEYIQAGINDFPNQSSETKQITFTGSFYGYTFELQRPRKIFSYSNMNAPFIQGKIIEHTTTSVIHLIFSPSAQGQLHFLFPVFFAVAGTFLIIPSLLQDISSVIALGFVYLVSVGQYALYYSIFKGEVEKDIVRIKKLLREGQKPNLNAHNSV